MVIGSHNSWSFKTPVKWWMKLLSFTAKCQSKTIQEQYEKYNVKCFDLRIRFDKDGTGMICHNNVIYGTLDSVMGDLSYLNEKGDVSIRILHDVRTKKKYTEENVRLFKETCAKLESMFTNLKFWCGRNLYKWNFDYNFDYKPECLEKYSSVCPPKYIDDWWPFIYARFNNKRIRREFADGGADILLIDFVNY